MNNIETLSERVKIARRDVERAKILYANREGSYDEMAAAAKALSVAMYEYSRLKFPAIRPKRIPYQAILR